MNINDLNIILLQGKTRAYSKSGELCQIFHSALPGGSPWHYPDSCYASKLYAILDCIWEKTKQVYYVLDVLFWGTMPFIDCDVMLLILSILFCILSGDFVSYNSDQKRVLHKIFCFRWTADNSG